MFTIRKATSTDCELIHKLAWQIFPETYKEILSKEQTEYMMEWMYSIENIRKQMEEEEHVYFIAYEECEAAGYVSIQPQGKDLFHLQKIYVLPYYQGAHCGSFLFREAVKYIKEIHPEPCMLELNVNRNNKALHFYEHMGMKKLREGDFPIGNGYYIIFARSPTAIILSVRRSSATTEGSSTTILSLLIMMVLAVPRSIAISCVNENKPIFYVKD